MSEFFSSEITWSKLIDLMGTYHKIFPAIKNNSIELLKMILTEEQAKFLLIFEESLLTIDQIIQLTDLDDGSLDRILNELMYAGAIYEKRKKHTNIKLYRLNPLRSLVSYPLRRGGTSEKERNLARIYTKLYNEIRQEIQNNYDKLIPLFKNTKPEWRVVPVEEKINIQQQIVVPYEEITKIIEKHDIFGVGHCNCRHRKSLIGEPCKLGIQEPTCMGFGAIAQFLIDHDFIKPISKADALKIVKKSEELGLVHNLALIPDDPEYGEYMVCSCCKCCCDIFSGHHQGMNPINNLTSYLAEVNEESCIGCGTCVEKCPMEAITLVDTIAFVNEKKCIGCGLCSYHCPEESMRLNRTGLRNVFILPPRLVDV